MGKAVAVSFEDDIVRVVYARKTTKDTIIEDVLTLRDNEFDDFLSKEKTKNFIVVQNFKEFFQDTLLLPISKKSILRKIAKEETRKRSNFQEFSFIYSVLGEKIVDNARMTEVFVFAVKDDELKIIADRFVQKGKVIRAIYPDIFSLASQIEMAEPVLCVSEIRLNKNLFLVKDKAINFVRTVQSFEKGLNDLDIQNINMTVNYCRQTLRINPSHVLLYGSLCSSYKASSYGSIPVVCFPYKSDIFLDFASLISALSASKDMNILPENYKVFYNLKLLLQYTAIVFALLSFIGLGHSGYLIKEMISGKERLESLRKDHTEIESVLSSYETAKSQMTHYTPFINDLKEVESFPDIHGLMVFISRLKTDNTMFDSVSATRGTNVFILEVKGQIKAESYADTQSHYEKFIKSIEDKSGETQRAKLKSHSLELKDRSFKVEVEYR